MSAKRDLLIALGLQEQGVSVLTNEARVREYVYSYANNKGRYGTQQSLLKDSWCQFFVNWLLRQNGYPEFKRGYQEWLRDQEKDDGFHYIMRNKNKYIPKKGDIYYAPKVKNHIGQWGNTHHMGFIIKVLAPNTYRTLDGNTGGPENGITLWTGGSHENLTGGQGGGKVSTNTRIDNVDVKIKCFLELPPMMYMPTEI